MKAFCMIMLALILSFGANAQKKKTETIVIKTKIYCDHCLECESCGDNITNSLGLSKGIKDVKINPEDNTITVKYNPKLTNPEAIRRTINNAGFDADNQKAPSTAVNKLDGCCKAKETN